MQRIVQDDGTGNEPLIIIGEAPGRQEDRIGRPFVGPAGYRIKDWMSAVGLEREDAYWTNVYPIRPQANKIEAVPRAVLEPYVDKLHERIARLNDPVVIVPTGNTALRALTGLSSFPWESKKRGKDTIPGILSHRGSIYEYTDLNGRKIKVIPTIHPAATFRMPTLEKRCIRDWQRIASDLEFRELRIPERKHEIPRDTDDLYKYSDWLRVRKSNLLTIDLEWLPGGHILCVGFSDHAQMSFTVPTTKDYWGDNAELFEVWNWIKSICESDIEKVLQHGHSDAFILKRMHNIEVRNYQWDTLALHHCLDPNDEHDLAYLASIFTRQPYWKDEAKDPDKIKRYASNFEALLNYNGIDCCVTRELCDVLRDRLIDAGLLEFYQEAYPPLFEPIVDMMTHGVRVDDSTRRKRLSRLTADCIRLQDGLTEIAGYTLYGKKSLSTKKLAKLLYDDLRLPKKMRTRKRQSGEKVKTVTTDEVAVRRLMNEHPKNSRLQEAGTLILQHRRKYQLSTFYRENRVDTDGRMRSSYGPYAYSGRMRSSANPTGTGTNAQNQDRESRDIYVPDEGCVLVELDLSTAEDRDVKVRTRSPRLIELAILPPWEYDAHSHNAVRAGLAKTIKEVTKEQRYLAKKVKHGTNYGEHEEKISDEIIKDGIIVPPEECRRLMDLIIDPEVLDWQRETRATILKTRCLANAWGRVIDFSHERLTDDLYRRAYAYCPSSDMTCELINRQGFVPAWHWLKRTGYGRINAHIHDAVLASIRPEHVWEYAGFLRDSLQQPVRIAGTTLVIWVELKVGMNWGEMKEWKKWPSRKELDETVVGMIGD